VPLFLPALEPFNINLIWFGIVTVIGDEIGLLTPPFGISCFVIKATIDDRSITLRDIFMGALPFAAVMLGVLWILIFFPKISLAFV
jgi:TRAP-type mannitol/chloroaromatic compound transport system permease large subunit